VMPWAASSSEIHFKHFTLLHNSVFVALAYWHIENFYFHYPLG